jgi:hypothetical protein
MAVHQGLARVFPWLGVGNPSPSLYPVLTATPRMAHGALTVERARTARRNCGTAPVLNLLFVAFCISLLLGLLSQAALREDLQNSKAQPMRLKAGRNTDGPSPSP